MKRSLLVALLCTLALSIVVPATLTFAKSKKVSAPVAATPTAVEIQTKYAAAIESGKKVRILIVPGHEPGAGGAEYQGVYEREITVETASQLANYLSQNPRLDVMLARDTSAWNPNLQNYFDKKWNSIQDFVTDKKEAFQKLLKHGKVEERDEGDQVAHAAADPDAALRLYGISKWANENDVDLVVHLHINDTTDHGPNNPSAASGFAVYVPDEQYGNSNTSEILGTDIAARLAAMNGTSTLPIENKGVVPDQELIALGAYDTLSVPSVLIEYAYITEPKFTHPEVRQTVTKDFAYETYLGLQDFLSDPVTAKYPTASLPYDFTAASSAAIGSSSPSVYALQAALHVLGFFPPATTTPKTVLQDATTTQQTLADCPISGLMGPCTKSALINFQLSNGWNPTGTLGPQTLTALNAAVGITPVVAPLFPISSEVASSSASTAPAMADATSLSCALPVASISTLGQQDKTANGDVTRLQKLLSNNSSLYPEGLITGYYGPATQKAVQKFQVQQGIVKVGGVGYGLVGPKTIAALKVLCK